MPCHYLEIVTSRVDLLGVGIDVQLKKTQIQTFVSNHEEVLTEESHAFSAGETDPEEGEGDPVEYYRGVWRFSFAEDKRALRDTMIGFLSNNFGWALVRYHECDHSDEETFGCEWSNEWHIPDSGSIPLSILATFGTGAPPHGG